MDPKLVGDECIEANPKHLAYANKVLFYILCNSLTPTNRPETINGIVGNCLLSIAQGICFDVLVFSFATWPALLIALNP